MRRKGASGISVGLGCIPVCNRSSAKPSIVTSGRGRVDSAEVAYEEQGGAIDLEPGYLGMPARVCIQRLFLRGEGVEQSETGVAFNVLVVPVERPPGGATGDTDVKT